MQHKKINENTKKYQATPFAYSWSWEDLLAALDRKFGE